MFALILGLTSRTYFALRRFMPTNLVLDAIHTRRGLKWGVPAMLLAVPYSFAVVVCVGLVDAGRSGWLNVVALLFSWNALKFLGAGPFTLMRLLRVRAREAQLSRDNRGNASSRDERKVIGALGRRSSSAKDF
jgi:hypothetical protein